MDNALTTLVWIATGGLGLWVAAMLTVVVIALVRIARDKD